MVTLALIATVSLLLFVHPYVTYPASLRLFRSRPVGRRRGGQSLSLLFSAYNEERSLPQTICNLRALKRAYPDLQIIAYCVVADTSSDSWCLRVVGMDLSGGIRPRSSFPLPEALRQQRSA